MELYFWFIKYSEDSRWNCISTEFIDKLDFEPFALKASRFLWKYWQQHYASVITLLRLQSNTMVMSGSHWQIWLKNIVYNHYLRLCLHCIWDRGFWVCRNKILITLVLSWNKILVAHTKRPYVTIEI